MLKTKATVQASNILNMFNYYVSVLNYLPLNTSFIYILGKGSRTKINIRFYTIVHFKDGFTIRVFIYQYFLIKIYNSNLIYSHLQGWWWCLPLIPTPGRQSQVHLH